MTKAQGQKRRAHGMVPLAGPQSAQMHSGIGSATKPAYEPVVVARKPLSEKNLVQNILAHGEWLEDGTVYKVGTGGLNIDQSRIRPHGDDYSHPGNDNRKHTDTAYSYFEREGRQVPPHPTGRFPSNTLWSHVPGPNGCVRVGSRRVKGDSAKPRNRKTPKFQGLYNGGKPGVDANNKPSPDGYADPDGLEEVPEYICAKDESGDYICPIALLDEQSGVSKSNKRKNKGNYGGVFGNGQPVTTSDSVPDDAGGKFSLLRQLFSRPQPWILLLP